MSKNEKDKNEVLLKHNTLVTARYSLSVEESRIFIYMLYKIQRNLSTKGLFCTITHEEFKRLVPNKNKNSIRGIKLLLDALNDNKIYFKKEKETKGNLWGSYSFISGYTFDDELKEFEIECSSRVYDIMMNHDYEKEGYYTPINFMIWLRLKNPNSQRFYDFIRLWANSKSVINYRVDDLRELMMLEDKYTLYGDFKKRVITPAIKELNDTGYFKIAMKEVKKNRKVESIDFEVEDLDKRIYFKKLYTEEELLEVVDNEVKYDKSGKDEISVKKEEDFYIPEAKAFTKGTLLKFKKDFSHIDFKDKYMEEAFDYAVMVTRDRDDTETIKANSYKFFKGCLENKIGDLNLERKKDIEHEQEMQQYWECD